MKRWQTLFVGIVISALALFLAFRSADFGEIWVALQNARYGYVALTAFIFVFLILIRAYRWQILTEGRLSVVDAFWLFNVGYLFNNVLPARLGEVVRAVLAGRKPDMEFGSAASTIVVERLFDMVAVVVQLVLVLLVLDLPAWAANAGLLMGTVATAGIAVLAFAAHRPDGALSLGTKVLALTPLFDEDSALDFLKPFIEGLAGVSDPRVFAAGLGLSIVGWLMSGISGWTLMLAFFEQPPIIMGQLVVAAAGLGIAVPAAPSGVGPFHAAVIGVMVAVGFDANISRSFAFALHAHNFIIPSLFGLFGLLREGVTFNEAIDAAESVRTQQADA